jgi:protease-4
MIPNANETFLAIKQLRYKLRRWRLLVFFLVFLLVGSSYYQLKRSPGLIPPLYTKTNSDGYLPSQKKKNKAIQEKYIARVKLRGILMNNTFSAEKIKNLSTFAGVLLDIDSPGGDVLESERLYLLLRSVAQNVPMVTLIRSHGTSGAYMVALASDQLVAYNTSLIGSIGVISQSYEITQLAQRLGVNFNSHKSSPLKGTPNPLEPVTTETNIMMSQLVSDIYDYFLGLVAERRKIKALEIRGAANGQIYTGRQALELGLIDKIGDENSVLNYFTEKGLNPNHFRLVNYNIASEGGIIVKWFRRVFGTISGSRSGSLQAIY